VVAPDRSLFQVTTTTTLLRESEIKTLSNLYTAGYLKISNPNLEQPAEAVLTPFVSQLVLAGGLFTDFSFSLLREIATVADEEPNKHYRLFIEPKDVCKNYNDYSRLMTNDMNDNCWMGPARDPDHSDQQSSRNLANASGTNAGNKHMPSRKARAVRIAPKSEIKKNQSHSWKAEFRRQWKNETNRINRLMIGRRDG
jgi:hypothetical protein